MTLGVGVIGLGFMGRTHLAAYRAAHAAGHANRVVAVCDRRGETAREAPTGNLDAGSPVDLRDVAFCTRPSELLARAEIEFVSVCTPTDSHVELALEALAAGKHVLVEKPVSHDPAQVARLAQAARAARRLCMPALCIRFWPAWRWLREAIVTARHGAVRSATFQRLSPAPSWGAGFYADARRSGGALGDLHVHDADFVRWCFGDPAQVVTAGHAEHFTTLYRFRAGPPHVSAEAAWDPSPGFPFRMRYTVVFERATADYEHGRSPELLLAREGSARAVELPVETGYDGEVRHLLDAVAQGASELDATLADAQGVARLLAAERRSLAESKAVSLPGDTWA